MASTKTYQCLSCRVKSCLSRTPQPAPRNFHTSPSHAVRKRNIRSNILPKVKSHDSGAIPAEHDAEAKELEARLKPYTAREKELLAMRYTPEQMAAIEAGEKAVDRQDMIKQGRFRTDPMRIPYIDDFATVRPTVDHAGRSGGALDAPLAAGRQPKTAAVRAQPPPRPEEQEDEDPHMLRLTQQTGLDAQAIRRLRIKNLVMHPVVNQTRMGKIRSLYFLTIAGNEDGMLGIGEGKAAEDEDARRQAMMNAVRNMKPIPRYEERTIYGDVEAKVGAALVQLSSRPPGFGNRCQHLIFELARAAGISDLAARTPRSRNKMNVVKAAYQALMNQRLPEDIARARGRKMVDVRGVYYGGLVH